MNEDENKQSMSEEAGDTAESEAAEIPGGEDDYAFMTETVRKRPGRGRKAGLAILAVLAGGALFGVTSGLIFRAINPNGADYISFEADAEEEGGTAVIEEAETAEKPDAGGEAAAATGSESGDTAEAETTPEAAVPEPTDAPEATPEPTPELTPEELRAAQLSDYKAFYGAMCSVAEEAEKSLVTVQGISSTEDWFDTIAENSKSVSGLIIADTRDNLLILTDQSVTTDSERLVVAFADGVTADASVLRTDPKTGLTVLTVNASSLTETTRAVIRVANLGNSYTLRRGQPVIAVGRPVGTDNGLGFGEITSVGDSVTLTDSRFVLVTTDIYGTSDGSGFLIDLDGLFLGVIEAKYAPAGSTTVAALAISPIKTTIERLSNNTPLSYLGIHGDNVTLAISAETGIPIGAYVTGVEADSPAARAGIQIADVITALDGDSVTGMEAYQRLLMGKSPEDTVTLTVQRLGAEGYVPLEFAMTVSGI